MFFKWPGSFRLFKNVYYSDIHKWLPSNLTYHKSKYFHFFKNKARSFQMRGRLYFFFLFRALKECQIVQNGLKGVIMIC